MTPEEAKKKWCPFVRVMHTERDFSNGNLVMVAASINRGLGDSCNCLGNGCACWTTEMLKDKHGVFHNLSGRCGLIKGEQP